MNDPSVERLAILKDAAELMIARESAAIDALIIELSD